MTRAESPAGDTAETGPDYKDTLFLPQTSLPMKAGLAEAEPRMLARWAAEDLYGQLRKAGKGREKPKLATDPMSFSALRPP